MTDRKFGPKPAGMAGPGAADAGRTIVTMALVLKPELVAA
jgi:hypothetical protein